MFLAMAWAEWPNTIIFSNVFYNDIPFGLLSKHLEHTDTECLIFITLVHKVLVDTELCSSQGFSHRDAGEVKAELSTVLMI